MENETRIEAEYSPMHCKVRLFGIMASPVKGSVYAIESCKAVLADEGTSFDPFLELEQGEAQHLLESLWRAGVRSPEITSTLGEINATKNHLKDMQRLVFEGGRK